MTGRHIRIAGWSAVVLLVALPGIAMFLTDEVRWGSGDFIFWGALLVGAGLILEFTVRNTADRAYRLGMIVALAAMSLLVWTAAAVGILDGADWLLGGVLVTGLLGAAVSGFRAAGMAYTLAAAALVHAVVAAIAWGAGLTSVPGFKVLGLTAFFVVLWLAAALLFRRAAKARLL